MEAPKASGIAMRIALLVILVVGATAPARAAFGKAGDHQLWGPTPPVAPSYIGGSDSDLETATSCSLRQHRSRQLSSLFLNGCTGASQTHRSSSRGVKQTDPRSDSPYSTAVSNEAGDIVEVQAAHPSSMYKNEGSFYTQCFGTIPYIGSSYTPCGYVYLYDATLNSSTKVPMNNQEEDTIYDACGNLVSRGSTFGWHIVGTEYWRSGWTPGRFLTIPANTSTACLGNWSLTYTFSETFTDGGTLTDSLTVPFLVTAVPISPDSTWGGGNPSELPCAQSCEGDPVNTATGDYNETATDLAINGRGPGLEMTRTYSSLAAEAGESSVLGPGWAFAYGMKLSLDGLGSATVTNGNGSKTKFDPGPSGFVAPPRILAKLVENGDGTYTYTVKGRSTYTFNAAGALTGIVDINGNKTTLAYNGTGQLQTATDVSGRSLSFSYNGAGRLSTVTDSTGRSVTYTYDEAGRLEDAKDVRGGHSTYAYDSNDLMLTHKDQRGKLVVSNTYDGLGKVETQIDGLKHETLFAYSQSGDSLTTAVTNPRGYVTNYEYAKGVLQKRTAAAGTEDSATWLYEHDPNTMGITAVTDPNGHMTRAAYDARGNVTFTEDALGHTTTSKYDALNDLLEHTDAKGVTTSYTYDSKGKLLTSSTPLVGSSPLQTRTTTYTYGSKAFPEDLTSITDPNGKVSTFTYDSAGNLASAADAVGDKATYTYDALGRIVTEVSPRGNAKGGKPSEYTSAFTYDAAGNRLTVTDPLGHKSVWTYDPNGNLASTTDPNGKLTTYSYDATNRLNTVTRDDGRTEKMTYDGNGNVLTQTNGREYSTSYSYDPLDHPASATDPLERVTSFEYDAMGNLEASVDPEGRDTSYSYDAADQLLEADFSDPTTADVGFGYDANGYRTSMVDGTGTSSFSFDSLGRLTSTTNGHGDTVSYGYDLAGNQTKINYPNGKSLTQSFDSAERLSGITDWLGNTTTFGYDANSNVMTATYPSATSNADTYAFNRADEPTGATLAKGKTTLASLTYTRDNNGQMLSEATTGLPGSSSQSFTYDGLHRLTKAANGSYAYDKADNPTTIGGTSGFSYDAGSQLTESPAASFSFNELGQRTGRTPKSGAVTTYGYDQGGHLTSVSRPKAGELPAIEDAFAYDGTGARTAKTVAGVTTQYTWGRTGPLPLLMAEGLTSYIYGPDGLPLERIDGSGIPTFFHHDVQGSTRTLTNSSGSVVATYSYDPYGNVSGKTGAASTPFQYDGQYTDSETGLQYLRARYYEPATAQFLSVDPLTATTQSPYGFASANPLNLSDPSGLCNANPFSGSFWTEGNCISESSFNPIPYYEREIEALEAGCSYWESVRYGAEGAVVAATDAYLAGGLLKIAARGSVEIVFGHGARHLAGTGLSQVEVEGAIQAQVAQRVAAGGISGPFSGTVVIDGQVIQYRAYVLSDGSVNVGTYFPVS